MKISSFLTLNKYDFFKGMVMAIGSAIYAVVEPLLSNGIFDINWRHIGAISFGTTIVYLFKNFLTPTPKTLEVDFEKTTVIDSLTKQEIKY
jgi:hypothetical protein